MELGVLGMTETERNRHMDSKICALPVTSGSRSNACPSKTSRETWVAGDSPPADCRIPVGEGVDPPGRRRIEPFER
jgi:hypothetical protein